MKSLTWFKERKGKRIFRDDDGCNCTTCNETLENGLLVSDPEYLFTIQNDFGVQDIHLNYRDTK